VNVLWWDECSENAYVAALSRTSRIVNRIVKSSSTLCRGLSCAPYRQLQQIKVDIHVKVQKVAGITRRNKRRQIFRQLCPIILQLWYLRNALGAGRRLCRCKSFGFRRCRKRNERKYRGRSTQLARRSIFAYAKPFLLQESSTWLRHSHGYAMS
jgi:hypothetical protein